MLQIANTLETLFMKIDPTIERFTEFKRKFSDCLSPHFRSKNDLEKELFLIKDNNQDETMDYSSDESLQPILTKRRRWNLFVDTSNSE